MKFFRFKYYNFIFLALIIAILSFSGGYFTAQYKGDFVNQKIFNLDKGASENVDFSLFWDALEKIENKYIGRDDIDYQKILDGAISGMVNSLGDPYTTFLSEEDFESFKESIDGTFEGVGIEIGIKNDILTVISPLEDSPAKRAGLMAGDKILKIDDTVTLDITIDKAVEKIRGQKGTIISLLISREGLDEAKKIEIERDVINVPSIKWSAKENNIAYIQLFRFGADTALNFRAVAKEINSSGNIEKIVLDLRNNPGGFLESSVEIASLFLPEDKLVVVEDYGNGQKDEYKTSGKPLLEGYPLVILVNEGTASASEILAGALNDQKQIQLIGETTFGKGSVQELDTLKKGSALKITVARWLTPSGKSINDEGLKPNIEVKNSLEDFENEKDPQIDKAIEFINNQ